MGKLNDGEYVQGDFLKECQKQCSEAKVQEIVNGVINANTVERAYSHIVGRVKDKYKIPES